MPRYYSRHFFYFKISLTNLLCKTLNENYLGLVAITNFRLFLTPICSTSTKSCTCKLNGILTTTV